MDLGKISHETIVFNLALTMLGVLRAGQWELPFHKSWHSLVFKKAALIDSNINVMENFNTRLTGT